MTTPSKAIPSRTRKTKSVSRPKPIQLTPAMLEDHAIRQALKEIHEFMDNWTDAERRIVGHLAPWRDPVNGMKEIRRFLGESAAKCKVIPFPLGGKRGAQVAKEA